MQKDQAQLLSRALHNNTHAVRMKPEGMSNLDLFCLSVFKRMKKMVSINTSYGIFFHDKNFKALEKTERQDRRLLMIISICK